MGPEYGNRFFLPENIKMYLKEMGAGKEWRIILDRMDTLMHESHSVYTNRCKKDPSKK